MILISAPAIGRLRLQTRKAAHQAIRKGDYGAPIWRNGILYVDLRRVENRFGVRFNEAQLECACNGHAHRIIQLPEFDEATHGGHAQA